MTHDDDLVVVGTTVPPFVMDQEDTWAGWLYRAEEYALDHPNIHFFVALELDGRGRPHFAKLDARLDELEAKGIGVTVHTFAFDDGATEIHTGNRLTRITMGQNMANDFAKRAGAQWLLFLAADCSPQGDAISRLLALKHRLVGGHVSTYCLDGPIVPKYIPQYGEQIREHMATAAFVLLHRDVFRQIPWRWDGDIGMSDDPCLHRDAIEYLGIPTYVHHGVVGQHYPETIPAIEERGHDMKVWR